PRFSHQRHRWPKELMKSWSTTSRSPSPSRSATAKAPTLGPRGPTARTVHPGGSLPSLTNHLNPLLLADATMSTSPSPYMSLADAGLQRFVPVAIARSVQLGFVPPPFWNQPTRVPVYSVATTSRWPSPLISATSTNDVRPKASEITCSVHPGVAAPSF